MKEIKLTQGKVALVDDDDYEYLNQFKWTLKTWSKSNSLYAVRYKKINGEYRVIPMHRVIMNTPIGLEVDHKDHNGLNNQKCNLRNCTHSDNIRNRRPSKTGTSKYLGVSYVTVRGNRYITAHCGKINLGYFDTEENAAKAYLDYADSVYGEFINNKKY